ncbi:MAG: plasmid mobilization relaxosome protein MobC [Clostridia bacterium]|nr:MobC family plasmid mobilization relaxosome protein [Alphaproteobacteria bacterium]MBR1969945.1 plasmid mobilization relaxosome protein MobC [Clostridia bacterium]MBR1970050.1 plasmid mobilization relaxosome protein MobC [Clostridia bacterium]MBR3995031.1 plasmid mobilization relaxosome protein MobC [Clostridia bacterium]
MANRQRNIQLKVWVNEEEKELIELKMAQLQTNKMGAYIRKMAIDGFVIYLDTENIKQMNNELSAIGRNINQIAKRINSTSSIYREDISDIKERLDEIWQLQRRILFALR